AGRAGRTAADPGGRACDPAAPRSRRGDREGEGLHGEGRGDRRPRGERDYARPRTGAAAAAPTGEGGAGGRRGGERDSGAARKAGRAGRTAADPGGRAGDRAAPRSRRGDREGEGLQREGRGDRRRRGERDHAGTGARAAAATPAAEG